MKISSPYTILALCGLVSLSQARSISNAAFHCSFETSDNKADLCNMAQLNGWDDEFDWTVHSGPTPSSPTGPESAFDGNWYAYIEASNKRMNDRAILVLPDIFTSGPHCVNFHYLMFGHHINKLQISRRTSDNQFEEEWVQKSDQGQMWLEAEAQVNLQGGDRIAIIGYSGEAYSGDIAIDEIIVHAGSCGSAPVTDHEQPTTTMSTTTTTEEDKSHPVDCDFENEDGEYTICGMSQADNDDFDWSKGSGNTPSGGTGPNTAFEGQYYIYFEASDPRQPGDKAILYMPSAVTNGDFCASFAYHMRGSHIDSLQLVTMDQAGLSTTVWEKTEAQGSDWYTAQITITVSWDGKAAFIGTRGDEYQGDLALDRILIKKGACGNTEPTDAPTTPIPTTTEGPTSTTTTTEPTTTTTEYIPKTSTTTTQEPAGLTLFSCDFEDAELCGLEQAHNDQLDWTLQSGPTKSSPTGPDGAYTGSSYIYLEASEQREGDIAILSLPMSINSGTFCLEFAYSMFGYHVDRLMVEAGEYGSSRRTTLWVEKGEQGQQWNMARLTVSLTAKQRLALSAIRGNGYAGDIAVDALKITTGSCQGEGPQIMPKVLWTCDFESLAPGLEMCGLIQESNYDVLDWKLGTDSTPNQGTGPSQAKDGRKFVYIEESNGGGEKAVVRVPSLGTFGKHCLEFSYHMYGASTGTLEAGVYHWPVMQVYSALWSMERDQGDQWHKAQVLVDIKSPLDEIVLSASRGTDESGDSSASDIAVDSFTISEGTCQWDIDHS